MEHPVFYQRLTMGNAIGEIYSQDVNRRSADLALPQQQSLFPFEVFAPIIKARIEEPLQRLCDGIISSNVWPFVRITRQTGPSQIGQSGDSAMLLSANMINLKRIYVILLREATIFATASRSFAHLIAKCASHLVIRLSIAEETDALSLERD